MQKHSKEFEALRRAGFQRYKERLAATVQERFWAKVDKRGPDECWLWRGAIAAGYGAVNYNGKHWNAHRLAFFFTYGDFYRSLDICHRCDVRLCCNPVHLFAGTTSDNMRDMWNKNRHPREGIKGEQNTSHILSENQVLEIRKAHADGITQRAIAKTYGVNYRTINLIVLRINWKHI